MIRIGYINQDGNEDYFEYPAGLWTIGRDSQCDMCLSLASVSAQHASLSHINGRWLLSDLGSTNGTLVNGELIEKKFVDPGDRIHFGSFLCWIIGGNPLFLKKITIPDV